MAWQPHTDQKNRAYSQLLSGLFPEQTKTVPRIIFWSIIFLMDLSLVIGGAFWLGLLNYDRYPHRSAMNLVAGLLIALAVGLFWLQGKIWYGIANWLRKRNELG